MSGRRLIGFAVIAGITHAIALTYNIIAGNWVAVAGALSAAMWFAAWLMAHRTANRWEAMYHEATILNALGVYRTGGLS